MELLHEILKIFPPGLLVLVATVACSLLGVCALYIVSSKISEHKDKMCTLNKKLDSVHQDVIMLMKENVSFLRAQELFKIEFKAEVSIKAQSLLSSLQLSQEKLLSRINEIQTYTDRLVIETKDLSQVFEANAGKMDSRLGEVLHHKKDISELRGKIVAIEMDYSFIRKSIEDFKNKRGKAS